MKNKKYIFYFSKKFLPIFKKFEMHFFKRNPPLYSPNSNLFFIILYFNDYENKNKSIHTIKHIKISGILL